MTLYCFTLGGIPHLHFKQLMALNQSGNVADNMQTEKSV